MKRYLLMLSLWLAGLGCLEAGAVERLVLIGGGNHPPRAVARFAEWAKLTGQSDPRVLIVGWASEVVRAADEPTLIETELAALGIRAFDHAPHPNDVAAQRDVLEKQIREASGIFFLGGQQHRVMNVVAKNPWLMSAFHERYRAGVVFGGTSAGTAIMSRTMITGDGDFTVICPGAVVTAPGLGMLEDVVLDQHFIRRQRWNRLMSVLLQGHETLGIGVDEDNALAVEGNRTAEVVGPGLVAVIDARGARQDPAKRMEIALLSPGQKYDLVTRHVIP